ncbi:MAG: hypothetical protein ACJ72I_14165 [Pseudonocardiaceae bacterium]|jgi:hypothetical protein
MSEPHTSGGHLDLLHTHPLVEEILEGHRDHARGDERGWTSYRGHVYRVFNMARVLVPDRIIATTSWLSRQLSTTSTCSARWTIWDLPSAP